MDSSLISDEINLEDYLQPLDVGRILDYDKKMDNDKLCSRNCTRYPKSRICYYKLVVEQYHVMGPACKNCPRSRDDCFSSQCIAADGIERTVLVFNRMLPGPAFHICDGDRVIVDLYNKMPAREVTIHWHGQLQRTSPWEDGVPFVTQCPVASNTMYRYDFHADTSGTHFYHSHSGLQLFDGLSGPFIVHTSAKTDPVSSLYDYDLFSHTILISDWFHELVDVRYPGYNRNKTLLGIIKPDSYLINGMGSYAHTDTPLAEFMVRSNYKYRFRIITDTSTTCSLQFAIEDHSMLLIAVDGYPVRPKVVRSLYLTAADIYDVVVFANRSPRPYWIRVQGYGPDCSSVIQTAILRYEGTVASKPLTPNTPEIFDALSYLPELNNVRKPCRGNANNLCLDEINSLYEAPKKLITQIPDQRFIFDVGNYRFTNAEQFHSTLYKRYYIPVSGPGVEPHGGMYEDTLNNKSNIFTPFTLLHDPWNPVISQMKCPENCPKHCECLHLIKLGYNKIIEMIFIDRLSTRVSKMDHPFHIHGHHWSLVKQGTVKQWSNDPDRLKIDTSNKYPLIRDSFPLPGSGFIILRFIADNPGFWLLHCHFDAHNENGMQVVLQVGEPEQFLQLPKSWPKCGNYLPSVYN